MTPFTVLAGIFTFIWPFVHGNARVLVIVILYGISSGAFVALIAGPIMAMGPVEDVGRRTGMYFTVMAIGALAGPPISGAIENATGGYKAVGIYAGMYYYFLYRMPSIRLIATFRFIDTGRCGVFNDITLLYFRGLERQDLDGGSTISLADD
jgi:MFS family permease